MTKKKQLLEACMSSFQLRLKRIQKTIGDISLSLSSETKSTAGDKHETGRAMLQLEREKAGEQLREIEKQLVLLNRIETQLPSQRVALGSFVITENASYFIAVSLGVLKLENEEVYAVSPESPIGKALIGRTVGEVLQFRDTPIKIIKIL